MSLFLFRISLILRLALILSEMAIIEMTDQGIEKKKTVVKGVLPSLPIFM